MAHPPGLDFLRGEPQPVDESRAPAAAEDVLPQDVADRLLRLSGVDGAWIETDSRGRRVVVLHYSLPGRPNHLPPSVRGMPVKIVGGEPISAQS